MFKPWGEESMGPQKERAVGLGAKLGLDSAGNQSWDKPRNQKGRRLGMSGEMHEGRKVKSGLRMGRSQSQIFSANRWRCR